MDAKTHIELWLPFFMELEDRFGVLPSQHLKEEAGGLTMEIIERSYVCLMACKEKYPLWYKEVLGYCQGWMLR